MHILLLTVAVIAILASDGYAADPFDDDIRALVCTIAIRDGNPCQPGDVIALVRVTKREAEWEAYAKAEEVRQLAAAMGKCPESGR